MYKEIKEYVSKCEVSNTYHQGQQREPLISHPVPSGPWQVLAAEQYVVWVLVSLRTSESLTIFRCLWEACGDFGYAWMFRGSVQRFLLRFKNKAFNIWERYYSVALFLSLNSVLSGY